MDTESLLALAPDREDCDNPEVTVDGRRLIRFGERLLGEGDSWKSDQGLDSRIERSLDYMSGRHFMPATEKRYRARVVANFIRSIVERKVGQLTDTVPVIGVTSRSSNQPA